MTTLRAHTEEARKRWADELATLPELSYATVTRYDDPPHVRVLRDLLAAAYFDLAYWETRAMTAELELRRRDTAPEVEASRPGGAAANRSTGVTEMDPERTSANPVPDGDEPGGGAPDAARFIVSGDTTTATRTWIFPEAGWQEGRLYEAVSRSSGALELVERARPQRAEVERLLNEAADAQVDYALALRDPEVVSDQRVPLLEKADDARRALLDRVCGPEDTT